MSRKRFKAEQIITMLREAEALFSHEAQAADVWRKLGDFRTDPDEMLDTLMEAKILIEGCPQE